ncbi:MAG: hypothetical protein RLZZ305_1444 [Actinomycetota bacterium]|jgi:cell division inhibitor SepF
MSFFRRAMDYLGLSGDETFDDYDMSMEYERPGRATRAPEPEYTSDPTRPPGRQRVEDTGATRRPDDSGLNVRPKGAPRSGATVRPVPAGGETVTVRPTSFNQAQEIGDCFRDGVPVIVNLEDVDPGMSRRIIDFASGLCYALGGTMEKVGTGVFLLKPGGSPDIRG